MGKPGKTISVTLPLPLVDDLQNEADKIGISRSRYISNLLLKWQKGIQLGTFLTNGCEYKRHEDDICMKTGFSCKAPLSEVFTCDLRKQWTDTANIKG